MLEINNMSVAHLACIGDAIYELKIREFLVLHRKLKIMDINTEKIQYVSAKNQAQILESLMKRQILTDEEMYTVLRARNYKTSSKPKNVSIIIYKKATALEALFGMLYLCRKLDRINYLIKEIVGVGYDS